MKFIRNFVVAATMMAVVGCSAKLEAPVDSQELRDQQDKTQQQADQDEVQYQKEQKKKK